MTPSGGGGPPEREARREWLERVERAADQVGEDVGDSANPDLRRLGTSAKDLSARIRRELDDDEAK